ncbi:MAG: DUF3822 family protein [Odoribacteraceae bacterium]|jgi:hypothetical protein|nr:DUF3822 family protein [Odoribacteraceae bacterium]
MRRIHHFTGRPVEPPSLEYTLSIYHEMDGYSFCVHDEKGELETFAHESFEEDAPGMWLACLQKAIAAEPLLARVYKRVVVTSCCREKMLLPDRFFKEEHLSLLWSFYRETGSSGRFLHHRVGEWGACVVSPLPSRVEQLFRELQPATFFLPDGASLVRLALWACTDDRDYLLADIHGDYFDLLLVHDRRLLLFNTFYYETGDDILYFMLNASRGCHLDEQRSRLILTGRVSPRGELHGSLSRYWPSPLLVTEPALNTLARDPAFNTSPFVHLLNLHTCES